MDLSWREQNDLVAENLHTAVKSTNGYRRMNCPLCEAQSGKRDTKRSMGVHKSGWYKCMKCESKGRIRSDELDGDNWAYEAPDKAAEPLYVPYDYVRLAGSNLARPDFQAAQEYLRSRNVPETTWDQAGIGVSMNDYKFKRRIIVPVSFTPRIVTSWQGYVGRVWENPKDDKTLRYLYPKGMDRGNVMWNQRQLEIESTSPALIVEGVFDGLPHWPHCVAALGKPGKGHEAILGRAQRPLVFCLDGDAWKLARGLAMRFALKGMQVGYVKLPAGTDPAEFETETLLELAEEALDKGVF